MPLTKAEKKAKREMIKTYGKKKGEQVFYAYENKHKKILVKGAKKRKK